MALGRFWGKRPVLGAKLQQTKSTRRRAFRTAIEQLERREYLAADFGFAVVYGGELSEDRSIDIATTESGDTYLATTVSTRIGSGVDLISHLVKYDVTGQLLWNIPVGRALTQIAIDDGDSVYIVGDEGASGTFVTKLDGDGNVLWNRTIAGTLTQYRIKVDQGDIFISGVFNGTVDFDPGPGVESRTANGINTFLCKLTTAGDFDWVATWRTNRLVPMELGVDTLGNIYASSSFHGTVDFDPGPEEFILASQFESQSIVKLSNSGEFIWAKMFGGAVDRPFGLSVDPMDNIVIAGTHTNTADFDPGPDSVVLSGIGPFAIKMSPDGELIWATKWASGITGNSYNKAYAVTTDAAGDIYVAGTFFGKADFDPGPGEYYLTTNLQESYVTKLTPDGDLISARRFGQGALTEGSAVEVDASGNVYIAGLMHVFLNVVGPADFDTTANELWIPTNGFTDAYLVQMKPDVLENRFSIIAGSDAGGAPIVRAFDADNHAEQFSFYAYNEGFLGGVRVASADLTGDGVPDIVTAPGAGGGPHVRIIDGKSGEEVPGPRGSFYAYDADFSGGVFVAVGDVDGDGRADIVTGADAGGGPHVRAFSGVDGSLIADFFAFDGDFRGGVRVAVADLDGDGVGEIVTASGPGGKPQVRVFSADGGIVDGLFGNLFPYHEHFAGGVYVSTGDLDGDGRGDIITGAGATGGPHVKAFSGADGSVLADFFAYDFGFRGGVRVGAADLDGDSRDDIITGAGPGGGPHARAFDLAGQEMAGLFAFPAEFTGGLFVTGVSVQTRELSSEPGGATDANQSDLNRGIIFQYEDLGTVVPTVIPNEPIEVANDNAATAAPAAAALDSVLTDLAAADAGSNLGLFAAASQTDLQAMLATEVNELFATVESALLLTI